MREEQFLFGGMLARWDDMGVLGSSGGSVPVVVVVVVEGGSVGLSCALE